MRRIKKGVLAPLHRMAIIVPPELRTVCQKELEALEVGHGQITEAGLETTGKVSLCFLLNLWLRSASRILLRVWNFRAGAVGELLKKTASKPWEIWLNPRIPISIETYVYRSLVRHEGLVRETVFEGITHRFDTVGFPPPLQLQGDESENTDKVTAGNLYQKMLVHVRNNRCEISLDSSGSHLHRRGYRTEQGRAPIRETLAAAILMRSGWHGGKPLIDGMCGSGTIAIEAAWLVRKFPPGALRSFLFENWPGYREKTWNHIRRQALSQSLCQSPVPIYAVDRNPESISVTIKNAERARAANDIIPICCNFLNLRPKDLGVVPGLVVLNPPYGKRLGVDTMELYRKLGEHLRNSFSGWQLALLAPERSLLSQTKIHPMRFWKILHGGIPITVGFAQL